MMKKGLILVVLISTMLFPFVAQGADVTFEWDAPTQNEDLTPLTDLDGFRLYQATTSGGHTFGPGNEVADIQECAPTGGCVGTVTLNAVPDGTYFWVVTAYDTFGNESEPSNEVTLTIESIVPGVPSNLNITIIVK